MSLFRAVIVACDQKPNNAPCPNFTTAGAQPDPQNPEAGTLFFMGQKQEDIAKGKSWTQSRLTHQWFCPDCAFAEAEKRKAQQEKKPEAKPAQNGK